MQGGGLAPRDGGGDGSSPGAAASHLICHIELTSIARPGCIARPFAAEERHHHFPFCESRANERMRIPSTLTSLAEEGLIEEVVRPLLSGKEAEVFLVRAGGELRVAKVYKEAQNRTFKNRAEYTEGRKTRNSRDQRAIHNRSRHGRAQDEAAWRSTEVDMMYRLRDAGVRVPTPHHFIDGVLVMEMIADAEGRPAPRLSEVQLDRDQATWVFDYLLAEVVRMLCAGIVHGDLSDFNVLMGADGPVIIDFPQSVDASSNQNARKLLLRDVGNLTRFLSRFVPNVRPRPYAEEMWDLYAASLLTPETRLTGHHRATERRANTREVLELIGEANYDERKRRDRQGITMKGVPAAPAPTPARHATEAQERSGRGDRLAPAARNGADSRPRVQGASENGNGQAHRAELLEPQPTAPRRRVVISVSPSQRRPGPRRSP